MALNGVCVWLCVTVAILLPMMSSATEYIVGDENGWTLGFDATWAQAKNFVVGDKLIFQYPVGAHSVFKVNGSSFRNCVKPPANEALTSGNDTVTLATPGRKWYICGVGNHCTLGQKLVIDVEPVAPAPAPAPFFTLPFPLFPSPVGPPSPAPSSGWNAVKRPFLQKHW